MLQFIVGLDLGQMQDYSALVIAQKDVKDGLAHYAIPHLQRFPLHTSYPTIVDKVKEMLESPALWRRDATLIIDATGCGLPVLNMFERSHLPCPVRGVWIHGGDSVTRENLNFRTPKRDLVSVVSVLLQSGRLRITDSLPDSRTLERELLNFKVTIDSQTGHDSYSSWRENIHDDLVLATALALWFGEHGRRPARAY